MSDILLSQGMTYLIILFCVASVTEYNVLYVMLVEFVFQICKYTYCLICLSLLIKKIS